MVGGVIASRLFYELAVIGGTGLYDNVSGSDDRDLPRRAARPRSS